METLQKENYNFNVVLQDLATTILLNDYLKSSEELSEINYSGTLLVQLQDLTGTYVVNCKFAKASFKWFSVNPKLKDQKILITDFETKLVNRPWNIILVSNLSKDSEERSIQILKESSFEESLEKIEKAYETGNINWQQKFSQTVTAWLDKRAAEWIDEFNAKFIEGTQSLLEFNKAVQSFTGSKSNILSTANELLGTAAGAISNGVSQISSALKSSNSELASKLRMEGSAGISALKTYNFETVKLKDGRYENFRVDDKKKVEIKALKNLFQASGNSGAIANKGASVGLSGEGIHWLRAVENQSSFNKTTVDFLKKQIQLSKNENTELETKLDKFNLVKSEEDTASETAESDNFWKKEDLDSKLVKAAAEANPTAKSPELHSVDANILPEKNKYTATYTTDQISEIRRVMTSLDAQMQRAIVYFSVFSEDANIDVPLKLKTPDDFNYFYFFYTNNFEFKPAKKAMTKLQYGAFVTQVALSKPDSNAQFSFNLPVDIQLSFWKFVAEKGLGINLAEDYYANDVLSPNGKTISLNFLLTTTGHKENEIHFTKFKLENVRFSSLGKLGFKQEAGQMSKLNVKGIYKNLLWYPNLTLTV